jgi:hypothetical protein
MSLSVERCQHSIGRGRNTLHCFVKNFQAGDDLIRRVKPGMTRHLVKAEGAQALR